MKVRNQTRAVSLDEDAYKISKLPEYSERTETRGRYDNARGFGLGRKRASKKVKIATIEFEGDHKVKVELGLSMNALVVKRAYVDGQYVPNVENSPVPYQAPLMVNDTYDEIMIALSTLSKKMLDTIKSNLKK